MSLYSPQKRYQPKINQNALDRIALKSSLSSLSNVVCIQNLVKKNSMFVPSKMSQFKNDRAGKFSFDNSNIKYKRQIECHKAKTKITTLEKAKSNLTDEHASTPSKRRMQNITPLKKPPSRDIRPSLSPLVPPTMSFYLKKGEKPIYLQLKMDIKKVQSAPKPSQNKEQNDKNSQKRTNSRKIRNRNFPRFVRSELQKADSTLSEYPFGIEQKSKANEDFVRESELLIFSSKDSKKGHYNISQKQLQSLNGIQNTHVRYNQQRSVKSTLTSYLRVKPKKIKEDPTGEYPMWSHIKNIVKQPQNCDQMLIPLIEQFKISQSVSEKRQNWENNFVQISAHCFQIAFYDKRRQNISNLMSKQENKRVQIASLTKIMTCLLILNISRIFNLDIRKQTQRVSQKASKMPGTSAFLTYSDVLTIYQLLHGLMLPSGNDAAVALGEWGGKVIRKYCNIGQKYLKNKAKSTEAKSLNILNDLSPEKKSYQRLFISHMNKAAATLELENTFFANTHGLMNERAYSTASDLTKLTCISMNNPIFRQIVGKTQFQCKIYNRTYGQQRKCLWKNTNKLLKEDGFIGVKTGVTPAAGPCLSSMFQISPQQFIVIIVLRVKSMQSRFKQSSSLLQQILQHINPSKYQQFMVNSAYKKKNDGVLKQLEQDLNADPEQEQNEGAQPVQSGEDQDQDE